MRVLVETDSVVGVLEVQSAWIIKDLGDYLEDSAYDKIAGLEFSCIDDTAKSNIVILPSVDKAVKLLEELYATEVFDLRQYRATTVFNYDDDGYEDDLEDALKEFKKLYSGSQTFEQMLDNMVDAVRND